MTGVLAIDAGKSKTRVARFLDGERIAEANGAGVENIAAPSGAEQIERVLRETMTALPQGAAPDRVCVGSTGIMLPSAHADRYAAATAAATGCADVVVTSDVVTTFAGSVGMVPGVVVAAGTGAITLGVGPDGDTAQVDGWGYLAGDAGSGFEIGRRGLGVALRAMDGRGGSEPLRAAAARRFGEAPRLVEQIHAAENPVQTVASFAADVADAADAGDETARGILLDAATELARAARAAADRVGLREDVAVAYNGGLFRRPLLRDAFVAAVSQRMPGARVRAPRGDALDGAYALACAPGDPLFRSLLHHRRAGGRS